MSTDLGASFVDQFLNINTKLKRRFLRRPNVSEAANDFNAMAIQCENAEQPTFAGHAFIGAAKCENTAGNSLSEADFYLSAARQFSKAELKLNSLKCYSLARENLEAAIGCYLQALNHYPEESALRISIYMEMAKTLDLLGLRMESLAYYEKALQTVPEKSLIRLTCLNSMLLLKIQAGLYDNALETCIHIMDAKFQLPENIKSDVVITRLLLALVVDSSVSPTSVENITNNFDDDTSDFDPKLTTALYGVMFNYKIGDIESLKKIHSDEECSFTSVQRDLIHALIKKVEDE